MIILIKKFDNCNDSSKDCKFTGKDCKFTSLSKLHKYYNFPNQCGSECVFSNALPNLNTMNVYSGASLLGNYNICAEWKNLFMKEIKQNEFWSRPKVWDQTIFWTLLPNFGKGHNESCQEFHLFGKAWTKVNKI